MAEKWKGNHFVVEIDGIQSPTIDAVQGLSMGSTTALEVVDAGTNLIDKISSGIVKFAPLILVRNMDGSPADQAFIDWFKEMFDLTDPISSQGSNTRRNGAIVKREFGQEVLRIGFVGAWIREMMLGDLTSNAEDLWKRTITLEHQGLFETIA